MLTKLSLAALVVILVASVASAGTVEISNLGPGENQLTASMIESSPEGTIVKFEIGAFNRELVEINGPGYYILRMDGAAYGMIAGYPELPIVNRSIMIPDDVRVRLDIISSEYIDIPSTPVAPSKGPIPISTDPDDVEWTLGDVYGMSEWYPRGLAVLGEPFIIRDFRGIGIHLNAFQYNPGTQTLRVYTSVTLKVVSDGPGEINVLDRSVISERPMVEFTTLYEQIFLGYDKASKTLNRPSVTADLPPESGEMLVIVYDAFADTLNQFVEWKRQKGMKTTVMKVSELSIGTVTSTVIENYIKDFYDTTGLSYVLLVGDAQAVPPNMETFGKELAPTDYDYARVAGSDYYADIIVGRFSALTEDDVWTQVQRTIKFRSPPEWWVYISMPAR